VDSNKSNIIYVFYNKVGPNKLKGCAGVVSAFFYQVTLIYVFRKSSFLAFILLISFTPSQFYNLA